MSNNVDLLLLFPPMEAPSPLLQSQPSIHKPSHLSLNLSPPLIAMAVVISIALLIILYTHVISHFLHFLRRIRLRIGTGTNTNNTGTGTVSFSNNSSSDFFFFSQHGLDESAIKNLPTSFFSRSKAKQLACTSLDCAVCLVEFIDDDSLRTLPYCSHAFHTECIDTWLSSHATCPLCRASVTRPDFISYSPFVPMRAARIRPSFDDLNISIHHEITEVAPILDHHQVELNMNMNMNCNSDSERRENFFLKRSHSFGFERMNVLEPSSTVSPWRFRQNYHHHHRASFWSKRWPSPFGASFSSSRVFSFRLRKSPLMVRRRAGGPGPPTFFPLSGGPGPSSRRTRSMGFYSSRMRCGDPEALLSPERLVNR